MARRRMRQIRRLSDERSANRLVKYCDWRASRHGYILGDGARADIENLAVDAIARLQGQDRRLKRSYAANMNLFERNFAKLIDEMVKQSESIPGYSDRNEATIGEETLVAALKKLCPLFPFC